MKRRLVGVLTQTRRLARVKRSLSCIRRQEMPCRNKRRLISIEGHFRLQPVVAQRPSKALLEFRSKSAWNVWNCSNAPWDWSGMRCRYTHLVEAWGHASAASLPKGWTLCLVESR